MPIGFDFRDEVFLITGGASGIGLAVAEGAREAGASVCICDVDKGAIESALKRLGAKSLGILADISVESECDSILHEAVEHFGKVNVLVNCAGVFEEFRGTLKQDLAKWRRVIDVNLQGAFLMSRAAARAFKPSTRGNSIVNVASVNGLNGFRASNAYGVSKAGVIMLTKNLATDLAASGIRVNAVAPGFIDTPMTEGIFSNARVDRNLFLRRIPAGHFGKPGDVARAILFLASNWASYITGTVLPVDGGWSAFGGAGNVNEL